jgi:hypothetical protein
MGIYTRNLRPIVAGSRPFFAGALYAYGRMLGRDMARHVHQAYAQGVQAPLPPSSTKISHRNHVQLYNKVDHDAKPSREKSLGLKLLIC